MKKSFFIKLFLLFVIILGIVVFLKSPSEVVFVSRSSVEVFNLNEDELRDLTEKAAKGDYHAAGRIADYYGFSKQDRILEKLWLQEAKKLGDPAGQYNLEQAGY